MSTPAEPSTSQPPPVAIEASVPKPSASEPSAAPPRPLTELRDQIARLAMLSDRASLLAIVEKIARRERKQQPADRLRSQLAEALKKSVDAADARMGALPPFELAAGLPVADHADELAEAIQSHQVVIVCGETGSGKSTQLPKILLRLGRGRRGLIGHTQPRRIAARSLATRISEEMGTPVGQAIGYQVRFHDRTSEQTLVKLMTDGILLAETGRDKLLERYDTIIIDEAHERSLNIDFLLGYLKQLLPKRPDLKLIITSATLDAGRFAEHFGSEAGRDGDETKPAPIVTIPGRMFPVEIRYQPVVDDDAAGKGEGKGDGKGDGKPRPDREGDWMQATVAATCEAMQEHPGDVLVFMPTERDIREATRQLRGRLQSSIEAGRMELLPLYGRLSVEAQSKVFEKARGRRVVLATNVAESSLTVPGIRVVIDPGLARISRYAARSKVQRLPIEPVSQASANQRAGRCGRVGPGLCIRLYSEADFNNREPYTPPEILRTNLAAVILQIESLRLGRIEAFPFIDPPRPSAIAAGYRTLHELGAIDETERLTPSGKQLARMPVDPRIGRMLIAGRDEGVLADVLVIAAALEVRDPRDRPVEKQQAADEKHRQFVTEGSDFLTLLSMWAFIHKMRKDLSRNRFRRALADNFLSPARVQEWFDVHRQLRELATELKWNPRATVDGDDRSSRIHRSVLAGMLSSIGMLVDKKEYQAPHELRFFLWPGSQLVGAKPKWVVASELVETTRRYARTCGPIKPEWIEPLAAHLVKTQHFDPHYSTRNDAAMVNEKVTLWGLPVVPKRRVRLAKIDPVAARELFLREGLATGQYVSRGEFQKRNATLLARLEEAAAKSRRAELMLGEEPLYEFFADRVPEHVVDGRTFEKWRQKAEKSQPDLLALSETDLLADRSGRIDAAAFPDALEVGPLRYPLRYEHNPGSASDGVTLLLPREASGQLDPRRLGWLVPGLLEEKVIALLKTLPKEVRRQLVPIPDTARDLVPKLNFGQGELTGQLSQLLRQEFNLHVPAEDFDTDRLPAHLQMGVQFADADDVAAGGHHSSKNGKNAKNGAAPKPSAVPDDNPQDFELTGLTAWTFGKLPEQWTLRRGGLPVVFYPTLVDRGRSVDLRMLSDRGQSVRATMGGMARLFALAERDRIAKQVKHLPRMDRLRLHSIKLGLDPVLSDQLSLVLASLAVFAKRTIPRTEEAWAERMKLARNQLTYAVQQTTDWLPPTLERASDLTTRLRADVKPAFRATRDDLRDQLATLCPPDFLQSTPTGWLAQYPRYLAAMLLRWEKLSGNLNRDRKELTRLGPLSEELRDWLAATGSIERPPEVEAYRWLLEEHRVLTFAQSLGTAGDASVARLKEAREAAEESLRSRGLLSGSRA